VTQLREACHWLSQWIERPHFATDGDQLFEFVVENDMSPELAGIDDEEILSEAFEAGVLLGVDTLKLCQSVAASAELPAELLDGMSTLLDKQNSIDPDWEPTPLCDCPRCRRGKPGLPLPEGHHCIYEDAGQNVLDVVRFAGGLGEGAADEPYYLTQVRAVQNRAMNRAMAFDREQREKKEREKEQTREAYRKRMGMRGRG
jgi:hypothetical protein